MYDLVVRGGRLLDPGQALDMQGDIALQGGRIAKIDGHIAEEGQTELCADDLLVVPGLIDFHVHVHWGVSHYGVDADLTCLARGVTTAVDAGSAGGYTYPSLKRYVIDRCRTRLYAFLNLAYLGMIGDEVGELEDLRFINDTLTQRVSRSPGIVGIKLRLDRVGKLSAQDLLRRGVACAEAVGKPLMVHIGSAERMHNSLSELLPLFRPGDIVTHTYHGHDGGICDPQQKIRPSVREARQRGVLFDVGHGAGSFSFDVARNALAQGFAPDIISSDIHAYSLGKPAVDLVTTMTKFWHLGMSLEEILARVTQVPASLLGAADAIGSIAPGFDGDLTLLQMRNEPHRLEDCHGQLRTAERYLATAATIRGGTLIGQAPAVYRA